MFSRLPRFLPDACFFLIQLDQLEEQFIMQDDYHPIPVSWSDNELAASHANQVVVQSEAKLHARHPAESTDAQSRAPLDLHIVIEI
jgi:hypothetical protein